MAFNKKEAMLFLGLSSIHPLEPVLNSAYKKKMKIAMADLTLAAMVEDAYFALAGKRYSAPKESVREVPTETKNILDLLDDEAPSDNPFVNGPDPLADPNAPIVLVEPRNIPELVTVQYLNLLSAEEKAWIRYECQTNLYFMADKILRNPKKPPLVPEVHGRICDAMPKCYPDRSFDKWNEIKEWVCCSFRGSMKSVIEGCFIVMCILCMKDIRILLLSGKLDLAMSILKMVRGHFLNNAVLRALFPAFCDQQALLETKNIKTFTCPCRDPNSNDREFTLAISTFDAVKAGWHGELLLFDDATNEQTSRTPELVEKTVEQFLDTDPLLEFGGHRIFLGTIWSSLDLPLVIRQRGEEYFQKTGVRNTSFFKQAVWTLNVSDDPIEQEERLERQRKHKLEPSDVTLVPWKKITDNPQAIWTQYKNDPFKFSCQYLMEPEQNASETFSQDLLWKQTRPIYERPSPEKSAGIFMNWDTAGLSDTADLTVGAAADFEFPDFEGISPRAFALDLVAEKFNSPKEIIRAILDMYEKHGGDSGVTGVRIELTQASSFLKDDLEIEAIQRGLNIAQVLIWEAPSNQRHAKSNRVMNLKHAMSKDLWQFYSGLPNLDLAYDQFLKFNSKNGRTVGKDDIPDSFAQLYEYFSPKINPALVSQMRPSGQEMSWEVPEDVTASNYDPEMESAIAEGSRYTVQFGS